MTFMSCWTVTRAGGEPAALLQMRAILFRRNNVVNLWERSYRFHVCDPVGFDEMDVPRFRRGSAGESLEQG
ncbi:MAG: hypothetical protein K0S45_4482 [Nitrospira sp.]|jgi:hypothetical protein|nr:hypothetical protein [Nitrospira sp.]